MKVLAFGEVLWDVYANKAYLGGATMNFAAHFKKCGGNSWIVTAVGTDSMGERTIEEIKKLGIETKYIACVKEETGKCLVTLDNNHIPSYNLLDNVAYDYIQKPNIENEDFDILYFGTLALRNQNNKTVLKQILSENEFNDVFVDLNIRAPYYSKDVVKFACESASIIKISDEELPVVMNLLEKTNLSIEESVNSIYKEFANLKMIIITKGSNGSLVFDCKNNECFECDSEKVEVVSTVGAGDSFSASFLAKYIKTNDIKNALKFATKISGFVVSQADAIPKYEVENFE